MSGKKSQAGLICMGLFEYIVIILLQLGINIVNNNFLVIFFINCIFVGVCYVMFSKYQLKEDNDMAETNRTLLLYGVIVECISFTAILAELRYEYKAENTVLICLFGVFFLICYILNTVHFFRNETSIVLKYIILVEFSILYIVSSNITSYWMFFMFLPMLVTFTVYGEKRFTMISGGVVVLLTGYVIVEQLYKTNEPGKSYYYVWMYVTILILMVICVACTISSSNVIGIVNMSRLSEVEEKQIMAKNVSTEVVGIGNNIKSKALDTTVIIENVDVISTKSIELFDRVLYDNDENVRSTQVQKDMIYQIKEMIEDVKIKIDTAKIMVNNTHNGVVKSINSVDDLKNKSTRIINSNDSVKSAMDEFKKNINKVKTFISNIEDIAEQTDLLSLNVSIESQRADGDSKEFMLVANEVRSLSDGTAKLVKDIKHIIDKIEENTLRVNYVINSVEDSVNDENETIESNIIKLNHMNNNVIELEKNINDILLKMDDVANYSNNIGNASEKLAEYSNLVRNKTYKVVENNQNNKQKVSQTKELIHSLAKKVEGLEL